MLKVKMLIFFFNFPLDFSAVISATALQPMNMDKRVPRVTRIDKQLMSYTYRKAWNAKKCTFFSSPALKKTILVLICVL